MKRIATLIVLFGLIFSVIPSQTSAQPIAPPGLTLNGSTGSITVLTDVVVVAATDPGALINIWLSGTCADPPTEAGPTFSPALSAPGSYHFQAFWPDAPAMVSPCLTATWQSPVITLPPPLTLNGVSANVTVNSGEVIQILTHSDATIDQFNNTDCSGSAAYSAGDIMVDLLTGETQRSYRARWDANGISGDCLVGSWIPLPPPPRTAPPLLTLNGTAANITVETGVVVSAISEIDARIISYTTADCSGPALHVSPAIEIADSVLEVSQRSYQAHWFDATSMLSPCLTASWVAPPRTAPPPLTANGSTSDITVDVGTPVEFVSDPIALVSYYQTADCSGPVYNASTGAVNVNSTEAMLGSAQAHWLDAPTLISDCIQVSFLAAAPSTEVTGTETTVPTTDPTVTENVIPSETVAVPSELPSTTQIPPQNVDPIDQPAPEIDQAQATTGQTVPVTKLPSTGSGNVENSDFAYAAFTIAGVALVMIGVNWRRLRD